MPMFPRFTLKTTEKGAAGSSTIRGGAQWPASPPNQKPSRAASSRSFSGAKAARSDTPAQRPLDEERTFPDRAILAARPVSQTPEVPNAEKR